MKPNGCASRKPSETTSSVLRQFRLVGAAAWVRIGALKPSLMPLESRLPLDVPAADPARSRFQAMTSARGQPK